MTFTERHPWAYPMRVEQLRLFRRLRDAATAQRFASAGSTERLPIVCHRHGSLLRRRLGDSDPQLQENKVINLSIAAPTIDGLLIRPGETFSFWSRVGRTTARKGYVDGLVLKTYGLAAGRGGGLCQLANLLYWMALHTPLIIAERHHHGYDAFPDFERVLPFGTGASVFYNYVDLRLRNPTNQTFQLRVWLTAEHLRGEILSDEPWPYSYHIDERNHRFLMRDGKVFRENEIWRRVVNARTGETVECRKLMQNLAEVRYEVPADVLEHIRAGD